MYHYAYGQGFVFSIAPIKHFPTEYKVHVHLPGNRQIQKTSLRRQEWLDSYPPVFCDIQYMHSVYLHCNRQKYCLQIKVAKIAHRSIGAINYNQRLKPTKDSHFTDMIDRGLVIV